MYLPEVERALPLGPAGEALRAMRAAGMPVPQIQHLIAFKPEWTQHLNSFTQAVMRGSSPLAPGMRELIAAFTSRRSACPF
ncbi:MAG TPA: peroxidase [Roseiflexaceae bacterium]|nr:peroxidase [Roseiflexaceae bacterium]